MAAAKAQAAANAPGRDKMETLVGLMLLSLVFFFKEVRLPSLASYGNSSGTSIQSTTNSWLAKGKGAKCNANTNGGIKLSELDEMDCQIREEQYLCQATELRDASGDNTWPLPYQCAGPAYDEFGQALDAFREKEAEERRVAAGGIPKEEGDAKAVVDSGPPPTWGRRAYGLPSSTRVLFFGNAHTWQMATALACQNKNEIERLTVLRDNQAVQFDFTNNSTLVLYTNPQLLLEDDWQLFLTEELGGNQQLSDFDTVILGLFNDCRTLLASHAYECESITRLFFDQIVANFAGPVLFVSEMAATRNDESMQVRDAIRGFRDVAKRKNMWFIHGRRYISKVKLEGAWIADNDKEEEEEEDEEESDDALESQDDDDNEFDLDALDPSKAGQHVETNDDDDDNDDNIDGNGVILDPFRWNVTDAVNEGIKSRTTPRCQGIHGGHADLLAWDITEFIYSQLV